MTIRERRSEDVVILELQGRLVLEAGVPALRAAVDRLLAAGERRILLDLGGVTYMDSCGLGLLIAKLVSVRRAGGDLRLVHVTPRSHHLLEITKLTDVFLVFDSEAEAVASFAKL